MMSRERFEMKRKIILAILIAAYFSQAHADMGTGLTSDIAMSKKMGQRRTRRSLQIKKPGKYMKNT
jgi:hypothetical protein